METKKDIKINSYPKIYNMGHSAIRALFEDEVVIQEKVDGSQFSFGVFDGELKFRSKGVEVDPENAGMFKEGCEAVKKVKDKLKGNIVYRGEYLQKPKHNTLKYDRTPSNHIVLFDLQEGIGTEIYTPYELIRFEAEQLGFDYIPQYAQQKINGIDDIAKLMENESYLGGCKIEGLVFKNYNKFTPDGKACMGKYVSEAFKEIHKKDWKGRNPTNKDVLELISSGLCTEARFKKAVQKLRDMGELQNSPKDIGPLMKILNLDVKEECEEDIKEMLYKWAINDILRKSLRGFPQWYKDELARSQFE